MTTERVLPAIAATAPTTRMDVAARAAVPVARPAVAHRTQPFLTLPARAGILLGTSVTVYAVSLAAVATWQSADDRAIAAGRQPLLDAIAGAQARNDALETSLNVLDGRTRDLATAVNTASSDVKAFETNLDELAGLVADVRGSTTALPTRIRLPSVSIRGPVASSTSRPRTTTTTRASGH